MRITFVVGLADLSGGFRVIATYAQRLKQRGHDVVVVSRPGRKAGLRDKLRAVTRGKPLPLDPQRAPTHMEWTGVPHRLLESFRPVTAEDVPDADIALATWWESAEWVEALPASKGAKVHFVQHYEAFPELPVDRVDAVWRLPIPKIAVAQWLVDLGREKFGIGEMALVANSVDHQFFNLERRHISDGPTVGFLYHEVPFKDLPTTMAVARRLKEMRPEVQFISFGAARPEDGKLPPDTEFHYLPTQEKIAEIYGRCHAWLSTSKTEGFNLPPLEAMACGCPAVCAKTGRPLEIIEDSINGFLVDQGDVAGFAEALLTILDLPDAAWQEMSQAAVGAVAHPTWEESSALFEKALIQAAKSRETA